MKRILCLWLPDWPAQRVLNEILSGGREPPESSSSEQANFHSRSKSAQGAHAPRSAREIPTALHTRDPRRGDMIAVCNPAARAVGVRAGMPMEEAKAFLLLSGDRKVPESTSSLNGTSVVRIQGAHAPRSGLGNTYHLVPYAPQADREALRDLAIHCERYSPCIGLGEAFPRPAFDPDPTYDSLLLDITSIGILFGGEEQLMAAMRKDFAARGYQAQIAIADNVATAWAKAHFPQPVPFGQLPIEALRLLPENVTILRELGIETIAQLAALPHDALASRFGEQLVRQLDRATGVSDELIVPVRPAPEFLAEWPLEHPTTDRAALEMILEQLAHRVGEALRLRDQGAVQLACRLDIADSAPRLVEIGLFRPSADATHFLELLRLQGETLRLRGAIGRVGLAAVTTARLEHRQKQLFAAALDNHSEDLAILINRLSNRLGRDRVCRPKLTRDAVPERAYEMQPLTKVALEGEPARQRKAIAKKAARRMAGLFDETTPSPAPRPHALLRPLTLLPEPIELPAVSVAPDGPPMSFTWQGKQHRVQRYWGPERIETAWWRGPSVRRDYYRVEIPTGQRYWLFRELRTWKWFLQGTFD